MMQSDRIGFTVVFIFSMVFNILNAQYNVNNAVNAVNGVQNVLLGAGVSVSNITYAGNNSQIGSFTCNGDCNLGISTGVVMGTGNVDGSDGPNNDTAFSLGPPDGNDNTTDLDLDFLSPNDLNNVARLEFDFIPTGDSLTFDFVFGSEEYPEFANTNYNDVFGFFLSGPGINGPFQNGAINIALLPNTNTPITINNINPLVNAQYYNANNLNSLQADGFTDVITAFASVQCGETYHIKLVIADALDGAYDSWVFLEANSFQSNQVELAYVTPDVPNQQNGIFEGCSSAELNFSRTSNLDLSFEVPVTVSGTATLNADYVFIPADFVFGPGQSELSVLVLGIDDGINEGPEQIQFTFLANGCAGSEVTQVIEITELTVLSVPNFDVDILCNQSAVLMPNPVGGTGMYQFLWPNGSTSDSYAIADPFDGQQIDVLIEDTCGVDDIIASATIHVQPTDPMSLVLSNPGPVMCGDPMALQAITSGGMQPYNFSWSSNNTFLGNASQIQLNWLVQDSISISVTDACGNIVTIDSIVGPVAEQLSVDLGADIISNCLTNNTLIPLISPINGMLSYEWYVDGALISEFPTLELTTSTSLSVELIVSDLCGNYGSDIIDIQVPSYQLDLNVGDDISGNCLTEFDLSANVSNALGNTSFQWFNNNVLVSTDPALSVFASENNSYAVSVTDQCGESASDTIDLFIPAIPIIVLLPHDTTINCLTSLTLAPNVINGVGNISYQWSDAMGNPLSSAASYTGLYQNSLNWIELYVSDQCNNDTSLFVQVLLAETPMGISLTSDTAANCIETMTLLPLISGGVGSYSYEWFDNYGNLLSTQSNFSAIYTSPSTVSVVVEDQCSNSISASVDVMIPPSPIELNLPSDTITDCVSELVLTPLVIGGIGGYSYEWTNSQGVIVGNSSSYADFYSTNEWVFLAVEDQCGNMAVSNTLVEISVSEIDVALTQDTVINCLEILSLNPEVIGGSGLYQFVWFNSTGDTLVNSQDFEGMFTTSQEIFLMVSDECANVAINSIWISVPAANIDIYLTDDTSVTCTEQLVLNPIISGGFGDLNFSWFDDLGNLVSNVVPFSSVINPPYALTLGVADECGNFTNHSVQIDIQEVPIFITLPTDTTTDCLSVLSLIPEVSGGQGAFSFEWLDNQGNLIGSDSIYVGNFNVFSSVQLQVQDQCSNQASASVDIDVPAVPIFLTLVSDTITNCITPLELNPTVSGGIGNYSYQWLNNNTGQVFTTSVLAEVYSVNTQVSLLVSDQCGNDVSSLVNVEVPLLEIDLLPIDDITSTCNALLNVPIQASGGVGMYYYDWQIGNVTISNAPNLNEIIPNTSSIELIISDECGNSSNVSFVVLIPPVEVFVDGGDDIVTDCISTNVFNASVSGGVGSYSYSWIDNSGLISNNEMISYTTNVNEILQVVVLDECGNSASDTIQVMVPLVPINVVCGSDTTVCDDDVVQLSATANGGVGIITLSWVGFEGAGASPSVLPLNVENYYTVMASDQCGNVSSDSYRVDVVNVTPSFMVSTLDEITYDFVNTSEGADEIIWNFPDGQTYNNINEVSYTNSSVDTWSMGLIAIDSLGCRKSYTEQFSPPSVFYIPNAFTPDGDGINDVFMPVGVDIVQYSFTVFDRWGKMVFYTIDPSVAWSGGTNDGEYYLPDGVYYYKLRAVDSRSKIILLDGNIILAR